MLFTLTQTLFKSVCVLVHKTMERGKPPVTVLSVSFAIYIYTSGGSWRCAPRSTSVRFAINTTTTQRYEISVCEALIKRLNPPAVSIYYLLVNYTTYCIPFPASTHPTQCVCYKIVQNLSFFLLMCVSGCKNVQQML